MIPLPPRPPQPQKWSFDSFLYSYFSSSLPYGVFFPPPSLFQWFTQKVRSFDDIYPQLK